MIKSTPKGSSKVLTLDELMRKPFDSTQSTVLVGGCFDILHYGHMIFLESAKKHAENLIILLESDEFIKKRKKREPFHTQEQRAHILENLEIINYIIKLPYLETYSEYQTIVKQIKPTVIAVTASDPKQELKERQAQEAGAKLKVVSSILSPFSSSSILSYASILRD
jgi:cytidyltransferase-like protein